MKIGLTVVDKFFFALRHCLSRILGDLEIQRLTHLLGSDDAALGDRKAAVNHRYRERATDHGTCLVGSRLPTQIAVTDFDGGQTDTVRSFDIDNPPASEDLLCPTNCTLFDPLH